MILHQKKSIFKDAISATAAALNIREVYIEKDYWVTYVLKNLSQSKYRDIAIFKGGTSLSKAYNIIDRFSEDIDLALSIPEGSSGNKIKTLITEIQKVTVGDLPEIPKEGVTSKGSKFRKTVHNYDTVIEGIDYGHASDKLLVEVNAFATPTPNSLRSIQTYIAQYLIKNDQKELIEKYHLDSFQVRVLELERTFTEKILGLVRASHAENHTGKLKLKIRHIYDIDRILYSGKNIDRFLFSPLFFRKIEEVLYDDSTNHEFGGEWLAKPLMSSPLFNEVDATWKELESFYLSDFASLVFGVQPNSKQIIRTLKIVAMRLNEYDEKQIK